MSIRPRDRFLTFRRDNFTCQYCGKTPPEVKLECDHIVARAKGGSDDLGNLITSCRECNIGKRTTDVIEPEISCTWCDPETYGICPKHQIEIYGRRVGGHPQGYTCTDCGQQSETSVWADDPAGWTLKGKSRCPDCSSRLVAGAYVN